MRRVVPKSLGYRMPAEWSRHAATWLAWPHQLSDWPGKFQSIPTVYAEVVRHLSRVERVNILVRHKDDQRRASRLLEETGVGLEQVDWHLIRTNRSWTRDSMPTFVTGPAGQALVDWRFSGWGRFENCRLDDAVGLEVAAATGLKRFVPQCPGTGRRFVLEGGSIDVNGAGLLLTTEECLLSPVQARNPGVTRSQVEAVLCDYLGVEKVLWLAAGIKGDDTHGHVDDLARFVNGHTVLAVTEDDPSDANHAPLEENLQRLRRMNDLEGRRLDVVTLPLPQPVFFRGVRLPASYANFYIANKTVLVPTWNDPKDRPALETLSRLFPGRTVIGIHCRDLVWGLGALHCITQQQPG
ncbi:MAG: agmatine/peptidylarginine deiminase [Acidobacteriota bacterium]